MKKWNKIIIDRSNKITKMYKSKSYEDFMLAGWADPRLYQSGDAVKKYYKNKESFFGFYLTGIYLIFDRYLRKNLDSKKKILSIGSGRCINELSLISSNYDITCSDIEIHKLYGESKKIFGNFNYIKFDVLEDSADNEFDIIYAISVFYNYSYSDLSKIFYNISKSLKKNGVFIFDFGGTEDNLISFLFFELYLTFEAYFVYYLSKIFNKKIGLKCDFNFGYRWKNREVVELASKFGFKIIDLNKYDYLTELQRSILIRKIIEYFPFSKKVFAFLGKRIPYIRMFKFKKI